MNAQITPDYPFTLPTNEYPTFAERLRYTMTVRGCTIAELADALYVSNSAICGYRAGSRHPDLQNLKLICQKLRVSADFLLGLEDTINL